MKKIVFITDGWEDTTMSGVIVWLKNTKRIMEQLGFKVTIIHPGLFVNIPLPTYKEIKVSMFARKKLENMLKLEKPDYIHISMEASLGWAARMVCVKNKWKFTTFYHTRFPEYVYARLGTFEELTYSYLRWFHKASARTMVSTDSLKNELEGKGFKNIVVCPLGVDIDLFKKNPKAPIPYGLSKPIFVYMGRIAIEKTIELFLNCNLPGSKLVIGEGPQKLELENKYRGKAFFAGFKQGQELVDLLSASDVFVFPSKTDTFSLVTIEALACGLPVAAFDVQGPKNILTNGKDGYLGDNLEENAKKCLSIDKTECVKTAQRYSWKNSVNTFIENLIAVR